ncbi:hypothetical protein MIND_00836400 [Mycena indigotica]|uniref:Uncharacterized protein n=1 Tax=Mycena indigotica TaxID=2126181 RepID=A0A8H6W4F1_9AGAR|nr:uncharacterized protein MIND_00836400 [Mycena indigotica]KAF7298884.1 hypothetical protein MIND_00836400 [Mycena indigotica]
MNSLATVFLTLLITVSTAAPALPQRDVFSPPVTYPRSGTVWRVGERHNVTWDMSDAPAHITNDVGRVVLVKSHVMVDLSMPTINDIVLSLTRPSSAHPLAQGFPINVSRHEIVVPKVKSGHDYQILVFGDSGNTGEMFTILE